MSAEYLVPYSEANWYMITRVPGLCGWRISAKKGQIPHVVKGLQSIVDLEDQVLAAADEGVEARNLYWAAINTLARTHGVGTVIEYARKGTLGDSLNELDVSLVTDGIQNHE